MISNTTLSIFDRYGFLDYTSGRGLYFIYDDSQNACHARICRVEAGWNIGKNTPFVGFFVPGINIEKVAVLWQKIEDKLGLIDRTVLYRTDKPNVIIFELPEFWRANDTVIGMLTLFIRTVCVYHRKTLAQSFAAYENTNRILPAIRWFLKGYTKPTYDELTVNDVDGYPGICAEYCKLRTAEQLSAKLIKPQYLCIL